MLFQPAYLTRHRSDVAAVEPLYAALDLETTGLDARSDRVCEVAVVRFRADGTLIDEYTTLIDPQRPIGASEYHGITDEDVADAPTFGDAWPDLSRMLVGSVVVAHNLPFEDKFLAAELARLGQPMPHLVGVCSAVACRSQLDGPSYSLQSLYRTAASEWIEDSHTALGDCRALTTLMQWLLASAPAPLWLVGPTPGERDVFAHSPGRIVPRAVRLTRRKDGYLGAIARRFPLGAEHPVDSDGAQQYVSALDEIIADRRVTGDEGWRMELLARRAGFTQQRLIAEHRKAWERATADLDLSQSDRLPMGLRQRLSQLAHDLGHPSLAADLELDSEPTPTSTGYLKGWRIGVDGTAPDVESVARLVVDNGGAIAKRITGTVRLMVAMDPRGTSAQLERAREFAIPVLVAAEAREHLRPVLEAAAAAERQRQEEQVRWQAERDRYVAEQDAYFRHRWHITERPPEWEIQNWQEDDEYEIEDCGESDELPPSRTWQQEVTEINLPQGHAVLAAWKRVRDARLTGAPISPARAAELGAALRVEFDRYQAAGGSWSSGIYDDLKHLEEVAGQVRGRFYVDWVPVLDEHRAAKRDDTALVLLLELIDAAERFAQVSGGPPAPAYTARAAVIYRRRRNYDAEVVILERWEEALPEGFTPGPSQARFLQRLEVARRLQHRAQQTRI
ncbi:3'-5' exonuclease [Pseudonocardia aurantiaca]|uniref:3'-5' exonuclease n=1 Tax=Pseudonocardia aurantiaca TaxID=75290 RepID=A0ABW4FZA2_9PSEU